MSSNAYTPDPSSPLFLCTSDKPGDVLVTCLLNEENYATWSRAMRNALSAKTKMEIVDGTMKEPRKTAADRKAWDKCNAMVISWIFNSVEKGLQGSIAYTPSAAQLWNELRERFSQGNAQRVHQLKSEMGLLKQEGLSVAAYYTKLKELWEELENHSSIPRCTCDAANEYVKEKEAEKLHCFLMGLNSEVFGVVRSQILNTDPLPSLSKVYSMVTQEERHWAVSRGKEERADAAAFYSRTGADRGKAKYEEKPRCDHCGKIGHEKSSCWQLYGKPVDWQPRRTRGRRGHGETSGHVDRAVGNTAMAAAAHGSPGGVAADRGKNVLAGYTEEQVRQLAELMGSFKASGNRVEGKIEDDWVIDTGASAHMTGPHLEEGDWSG